MNNILSLDDFLLENKSFFNDQQISECLTYLNTEDPELLEKWYNTVLDFAALIPGIGSIAEGINLVSYAKQGEYLLAGLCAIGLIPLFGQYIGAGGSLLVKAIRGGATIGGKILSPLIKGISHFFPSIVKFLKSAKFLEKFKGIGPFIEKIISSLGNFVMSGGKAMKDISPIALKAHKATAKNIIKGARRIKTGVKTGEYLFGDKEQPSTYVPSGAYTGNVSGYNNIKPYDPQMISRAQASNNWADDYL
jgi:hypothetical protein